MITVEMDEEVTKIVVLDESDLYDDIDAIIHSDDSVLLSQYNTESDDIDIIYISFQQLNDLLLAMDLPVGAYHTRVQDKWLWVLYGVLLSCTS